MSVIRKKVGQVWRLNYYTYPLRQDVYTISDLPPKDTWGGQDVFVVDSNGRDYHLPRRSMTTSHGRWTYLGMNTDAPKPWVLTCRRCRAKTIIETAIQPGRIDCDQCGAHNGMRV